MSRRLMIETEQHIPNEKKTRVILWYRTSLPKDVLRDLHERSDLLGALQTLGYLAVLICTGALSFYSAVQWPGWVTIPLLFLHGTVFAFQINAVHELGHGTVFKTKRLNQWFESVFAFLVPYFCNSARKASNF